MGITKNSKIKCLDAFTVIRFFVEKNLLNYLENNVTMQTLFKYNTNNIQCQANIYTCKSVLKKKGAKM